jgi:hypothetical protein
MSCLLDGGIYIYVMNDSGGASGDVSGVSIRGVLGRWAAASLQICKFTFWSTT